MASTAKNSSLDKRFREDELSSKAGDFVSQICGSWTGWQFMFTALFVLVAYDQGTLLLSEVLFQRLTSE
jgi:hypothetical protein